MITYENKTAAMNRLSRSAGHLGGIKKMIEDGRDCRDILIQLSAVKAEIAAVRKVLLKDYIDDRLSLAKTDNENVLAEIKEAIDILIRE